jgi:hypothetical protein
MLKMVNLIISSCRTHSIIRRKNAISKDYRPQNDKKYISHKTDSTRVPTFFEYSIDFSNDTGQHGVQDVPTINEWLTEFKNTIPASKWPLFKRIVTDFSWANIIVIRKAWNNMIVVKYLDEVYESVSSGNKINCIILVHLWHAHIMKNMTDDISNAYERMKTT